MPYARKRTTKKRAYKPRATRKTRYTRKYPARKAPVRRFKSAYPHKFTKRKRITADIGGARILAATASDPSMLSMYRGMSRLGASGLSKVNIKGRSSLPDVYNCKFRYAQDGIVGPVGPTAIAVYGNSIIDPGRTTDSGDCAYVPELGALYLYYRVKSSKIQIHMQCAQAMTPITFVLFKTIIPPAQWSTTLPLTLEGWVTSDIPHKIKNVTTNNTDRQIAVLDDWCSTSALFNNNTDIENFTGLMPNTATGQSAAVPDVDYQWFWGITCFNYDGSTTTAGSLRFNTTITYWTTLDGPVVSSEYQPGPDESVPDAAPPPKSIRKKSIAPPESDDEDFVPVKKTRFPK